MVIHVRALRAGDGRGVENEIGQVVRPCHERGALLKVFLEAELLTNEEKISGAMAAMNPGASRIVTSSGAKIVAEFRASHPCKQKSHLFHGRV